MLRPYIFLRQKFCRDFRRDAQALRLTRTLLPRTIRGTV